jgi:Zn-finger nucleic acid-binding protein
MLRWLKKILKGDEDDSCPQCNGCGELSLNEGEWPIGNEKPVFPVCPRCRGTGLRRKKKDEVRIKARASSKLIVKRFA